MADLISVPFQNNTSYNIGTNERASNTLNIQPVISNASALLTPAPPPRAPRPGP